MILDATPINEADARSPAKFRLPGLEGLRDWLRGEVGGGKAPWLAKLDIQNAFWSIKLPRLWRRIFVLRSADGRAYRYTRLPFGWRYSPLVCQTLVRSIVAGALRGTSARAWVYIDDILFCAGSKRELRSAVRRVTSRLRRAGFIISIKSEPKPVRAISFIGKHIDSKQRTIQNAKGGVQSALRAWVRAVGRGTVEPRRLRKLLGQLCWLSRPGAGLSCFMAGSYRALEAGSRVFTRGMARGLGTVLVFSAVAHTYPPERPKNPTAEHSPRTDGIQFFTDAAEEGRGFRVVIVGATLHRSSRCPQWIRTLQQAEFYGVYMACKMAVYMGWKVVTVGTDSEVSRCQTMGMRAAAGCPVQQRILRRIFWLRLWSNLQIGTFWVESALNPADPMSRLKSLPSRKAAIQAAEERRRQWSGTPQRYKHLEYLPRSPWMLRAGEGR